MHHRLYRDGDGDESTDLSPIVILSRACETSLNLINDHFRDVSNRGIHIINIFTITDYD